MREKRAESNGFFDEKTATRDTFKYYENGAETAADGDKIGKEIFGLDEEAFIRALTFDAREAEIAATDGMKERLGAIAEGTAGGRNAAAAIEILEKRRKEICGDRKNADSELFRLDKERKKIGEEMLALEAVARAADDLYAERARLKRDVAEAEEAETSLSGQEALEEKRARYEELVNQAKEAGEKRAGNRREIPRGACYGKGNRAVALRADGDRADFRRTFGRGVFAGEKRQVGRAFGAFPHGRAFRRNAGGRGRINREIRTAERNSCGVWRGKTQKRRARSGVCFSRGGFCSCDCSRAVSE